MTQKVNFYQSFFRIKKGVFIPQKDTEVLLEKLLELAEKKWKKKKLRVLDIGTGCGNIAISLAKIKPDWQFLATDINPQALQLATQNALIHQVKNVKFWQSDLFSNLDRQQFDIIVSNPPYVSAAEYQQLSPRTKKQPPKALVAPQNGDFFYQKIYQVAPSFLSSRFLLLTEIGSHQEDRILALARQHFPAAQIAIFRDYANRPRVVAISDR